MGMVDFPTPINIVGWLVGFGNIIIGEIKVFWSLADTVDVLVIMITLEKNMSNNVIVYLLIDNGVDGMAKDYVVFASLSEAKRDEHLKLNYKSAPWLIKVERIVDPIKARNAALKKLDGIDKLFLLHTGGEL